MRRPALPRPKEPERPSEIETIWWATIQRDGFACRIAPFLPDLICAGDLEAYGPTGDLAAGAVTACEAHCDWIAAHPLEAAGLGLVMTDVIEIVVISREDPGA